MFSNAPLQSATHMTIKLVEKLLTFVSWQFFSALVELDAV